MASMTPSLALTALDDLPAVAVLPPDVRRLLAGAVRRETYGFGQVVVREGDPADAWFLIESGRARVVRQGEDGQEVPLGLMDHRAAFGEIALLEGGTRSATVRATEALSVLRLDRAVFDALVKSHPELRDHLRALVRHRQLNDFLRGSPTFGRLADEDLGALLLGAQELHLDPEQLLF